MYDIDDKKRKKWDRDKEFSQAITRGKLPPEILTVVVSKSDTYPFTRPSIKVGALRKNKDGETYFFPFVNPFLFHQHLGQCEMDNSIDIIIDLLKQAKTYIQEEGLNEAEEYLANKQMDSSEEDDEEAISEEQPVVRSRRSLPLLVNVSD